jgi:hypothetical protein
MAWCSVKERKSTGTNLPFDMRVKVAMATPGSSWYILVAGVQHMVLKSMPNPSETKAIAFNTCFL